MRTADDAIDRGDRSGAVLFDEPDNCLGHFRVGSRIGGQTKPPLKGIGIRPFVCDDANRYLGRPSVVGPIEGNRRDRVAAKALPTSFRELVPVPTSNSTI